MVLRYYLFLIVLIALPAQAQKSIIREIQRTITTYPFSDPDPVARPGRVYPYFRFDGFTNKSEIQNWKMIELENDYIQLAVMPEMGGKVWEAYEKSQEYPFVFTTKVVKFRDISLRGAWTTGGLEFNFGDIGHGTTVSTPVDHFTRTNNDGSVSCFIGATDWASRTTWRVEIILSPDKAYFTTRSWWYNNTPVEQEFYHWVNAGYKADGNLEFAFPGTHHIGHGGLSDTWPLDSVGRKISFYEHNNFGSYKSYHILGRPSGFYGAYWHDDNMGFGHYSPYYEKLGKKVWILGLSQEGTRWENLLGDNDGLNVEMQSGRLFNQASRGSEFTPFKHVGFAPYSADTWEDHWFPVRQTRGLTNASLRGALNIRVENNWLKIDWMSLENQSDTISVFSSGSSILKHKLLLKPMELFRDSVKWKGSIDQLTVRLGKDVLTGDQFKPINRPLNIPDAFDWQSDYGLMTRGLDLYKQKNYSEAETYLLQALEKNPNLIPAITGMAQIRFRQGLYSESREFAYKALAINTYDPEANYFWAVSSEKTGHESDALDGFSVATLSPAFRQAAWLRIAGLSVKRRDWDEAAGVLIKCLDSYPPNEMAWNLKVIIDRKNGNTVSALNSIENRLEFNPLNHLARFEKYLNTGRDEDKNHFVGLIRQELPHETYIEMALQYYGWNLEEEALKILELAPVHPVVELLQAFLFDRAGQKEFAEDKLAKAVAASPEFIFPFRPEMTSMFSWANKQKPDWKWRYYEALIYWQYNQAERAKALFIEVGNEPDFIPFYLSKAELFKSESAVVRTSLEKAYMLDPTNWRTGLKLARFYAIEKNIDKALTIAQDNYKAHQGSFVVGLQYAQMLKLNGRYPDALDLLSKVEMLPAEGDVNAHNLFRETNILFALNQMKARRWKRAILSLKKAEEWPENLFSGEPYLADNRITQFMAAYCYQKLRIKSKADEAFKYLETYSNPDGRTYPLGNSITRLVKGGNKDFRIITESLLEESSRDRDLDVLVQFMDIL